MSKPIAFFDFDGTITTKDTLLEIIKFRHGNAKFYMGFLLHSPYLVMMKLGLMSNQAAKQKIWQWFFGGMKVEDFQVYCEQFAAERLPSLIRPKALTEIDKLKQAGAEIVVVSASAEDWLRPWCHQLQVGLMGTRLEVVNGKITGRINGKNCHGEEKVRRIRAVYDLSQFKGIYCYGDTSGDKPMLALADHAFYQPFR